jgi:hypothetical protein
MKFENFPSGTKQENHSPQSKIDFTPPSKPSTHHKLVNNQKKYQNYSFFLLFDAVDSDFFDSPLVHSELAGTLVGRQ